VIQQLAEHHAALTGNRPEPLNRGQRLDFLNASETARNEATSLRTRRPRAARRAGK
jgi:hypothetical protein